MPNTVTWLLWLALAFAYSMLTYNPAYLILLLIALSTVAVVRKQPVKTYMKIGLLVSIMPLLVNIFLVHSGNTVLYRIPRHIPMFGLNIPLLFLSGPVTLESVGMGAIMALLLVDMLVAFQVFNSQTTPDSLVNIIPSCITSISMTGLIALRFIPTVTQDFTSIRDAQKSRGFKFDDGSLSERLSNNISLLLPTLVTSLERGFNLSESMAARAYSGRRSRYRTLRWTNADRMISLAYASSLLTLVYLKFSGSMYFWPYESMALPAFNVIALIPAAVLLLPALTYNGKRG
ncbi:MAG: energy-coupling factor transporter transmembrane component T [Candidatus Altiarchaeota archaeon]